MIISGPEIGFVDIWRPEAHDRWAEDLLVLLENEIDRAGGCKESTTRPVQPLNSLDSMAAEENARGRSRSPNRFGAGGGGREPPAPRPGDWTCPSCNANVFASRKECFRCHAPSTPNVRVLGQEALTMGSGQRREGDWTCPSCSANVYASRNDCFKCRTAKPTGTNTYGMGIGSMAMGGMGGMGGMQMPNVDPVTAAWMGMPGMGGMVSSQPTPQPPDPTPYIRNPAP
jgi:hypothetical protein